MSRCLFPAMTRRFNFAIASNGISAVMTVASLVAVIASVILCQTVSARIYQDRGDCFGMNNRYRVKPDESLIEIARKFNLGFNELADANPLLNPFIPAPGTDIEVPVAWIVPMAAGHNGIVINLAEMRLYFFAAGNIITFPVGIGEEGRETPVGTFHIIEKIINPVWHVPASILAERPGLFQEIEAGPDNPLGTHALRLSLPDILIHGTNKPWGQGRRVSHGCIRLYPEDIGQLYEAVPLGMPVTIVNQAVKIGTRGNLIFAEIHKADGADYLTEALTLLRQMGLLMQVDLLKLKVAIFQKKGMPVEISK